MASQASHPLIARVAVNRCWQKYSELGLVKSIKRFGAIQQLIAASAALRALGGAC